MIAVLLVLVGPAQQHSYHHALKVKPEAATAVVVAPDDGHEDTRNMLSCVGTYEAYSDSVQIQLLL